MVRSHYVHVWARSKSKSDCPVPPGGLASPHTQLVLRQINGALTAAGAAGGQSQGMAELALSPPELDTVRMFFSVTEVGLSVQIAADRPETQDLLRRNADLLLRDLRDAGQTAVTLAFSGGGSGQRGPAPDAAIVTRFAAEAAVSAPPYAPAAMPQGGRLDLRL